MKNTRYYLFIFLAVVIGEITLILLSSLVQGVLYDGIFWTTSTRTDLIIGGFLTFLTAMISGYVALWIAQRMTYIPHFILSLFICTETTWLIATHQTPDPAWFDALAGLSLIVGVWLGGWFRKNFWMLSSLGSRTT
ncbi:MAG TPA: hypothetical protein VI603_17930 [Saprospiraceae bacterium]|nr:hypothetical protein [Saprospiraceae bacterium]